MSWIDILKETVTALTANKIRTGLTMLGIVIGISSVIVMVSIGQGAQSIIESNIKSIGSNLIMVMPGAQRSFGGGLNQGRGSAKSLTNEDLNAIGEIVGSDSVTGEVSGRYQVSAKGKNSNTTVDGTTASYTNIRNLDISLGSFITDQNVRGLSKVAVLGPTVATDIFGEGADPIGESIRIKGIEFKIIGVTKSKGGTGFGNQDDMVFIPLSTAQRYLSGDEYLSTIDIQVADASMMSEVQAQVNNLLLDRHKIKDPTQADFNILNQADIVSAASSVTGTFTILLAAVAGISLIVGGIGIMNMMLTTVTERTKEIGLRKAIGARNSDINNQFLTEAVMITFIGGVIGVFLGWTVSYVVSLSGVIQTQVSLFSVLLAFGVSALIGILFGYYPARRAAKLNPIQALRYE
jgi:putative ABC transport system permease protein